MKLKVWEGSTLNESTLNLVKSIDNSDMDIEHIIIVPDRFSLLMEKLVLNELPRKAMFNVSVVGLTSLVYKLFDEAKIKNYEVVSMMDALLFTANAINQVETNVFKKKNINFCYEMYKIISQLKSSGVIPQDLLKYTGVNQKKYNDIGLIYEEYERQLSGKLDANGLLEYFNKVMQDTDILKKKIFYFAQFDSFTHETYELIKTVASLSKEVHISLACPSTQSNAYIYEDDILNKLKALTSELGIMVEVVSPPSVIRKSEGIVRKLYSIGEIEKEQGDFVSLFVSPSVQEECENICKMIRYKVFKGAKYSDFSIACGDLQNYSPFLEKYLQALSIPYYIDLSQTADSTLLAKFIFHILQVLSKDYSKEALKSLASNLIFALDDPDSICMQIDKLNINGKPRYKKYLTSSCPKFENTLHDLEKANTFSEITDEIIKILENYEESYLYALNRLEESGLIKDYNINIQAKDIILQTLGKIKEFKSDEVTGKSEYLKYLKLLLTFKEVSTVPTYVDAVFIGDAGNSYFYGTNELVVMGGQKLPYISSDNGLLNDDDIKALSLTRKIEPSIRMINRRNRFKLFNLLSDFSRTLTISFLGNSESGKVEVPNFIDNISRIYNRGVISTSSLNYFDKGLDLNIDRLLFSIGNKNLVLENRSTNIFAASILNAEEYMVEDYVNQKTNLTIKAHDLFFPKDYTKVTQLECYFDCPFKHFVRYGLRASEQEIYEFDQRDIGNVCHKLAEKFVLDYKNRLGSLMPSEIQEYISKNLICVIKEEGLYEKLEATIDKTSLLDYIERLAKFLLNRISSEQRFSQFKPLFVEKNLSGFKLNYGDDKTIEFLGKIDRIDVADDYFRVMDYKTGLVSPILKDLYYGDKLQLFLYASASGKLINKKCAGTFYFDSRFDYDKEDEQNVLLKGLVINDNDVLPLFDYKLQSGASDLIAVSPKISGGFKGTALAKFPLSTFEEYAKRVSAKALEEIESGYIEAKPSQNSCEKCPYFSICLIDKNRGVRKKERINQEDIYSATKEGTGE